MDTIVDAIHMLEGKNAVPGQIVYDIIQGRYGGLSPNSLADGLSQSLSASMVEHARLFNLLVDHVNQDQLNISDSILPPSQLLMDLRKQERTSRSNKRVLSEIDVSEWELPIRKFTHVRANKVANPTRSTSSSKLKLALKVGD
jgi:hypothetical protein